MPATTARIAATGAFVIPFIYVEKALKGHPRVEKILKRHPRATVIECERYGEVFNPKSQNLRLQKSRPSLILARKHRGFVQEAPPAYSVGGDRNYYFSHMLNCVYDCRYCFIQGMYRSGHYVVFINYEDFLDEIDMLREPEKEVWFFSGYDSDSLALEPVTGFVDAMLPFFAERPDAWLELRTKSTQIKRLLERDPLPNVVSAFSFTPEAVWKATERMVPNIDKRLNAMKRLIDHGWTTALRIDPLILHADFENDYGNLIDKLLREIPEEGIHSVVIGPFRLPKEFHRKMERLYPEEPLFAATMAERGNMVSCSIEQEKAMLDFCTERLMQYIPEEKIFPNLPEDQG